MASSIEIGITSPPLEAYNNSACHLDLAERDLIRRGVPLETLSVLSHLRNLIVLTARCPRPEQTPVPPPEE